MSQTKVAAPFVANNANFRNLIINGDMSICQRSTSVTGITASGYRTADRWDNNLNDHGTFTQTKSTDVPDGQGFTHSVKLDCTTADASVASGSYFRFQQKIEAQFLAPVMSGTANAKTTVMSFWIKFDNVSGDFCADVLNINNSNNRVISKKFTYGSGAGWQKYTFVIPGDTDGNALTIDNSAGYYLQIFLGAGSDLTSGTLQTTWATRVNANRAAGQSIQIASSTDNNVYITGVQYEIGDQATDFEHLPHDINLQRCLRYCVSYSTNVGDEILVPDPSYLCTGFMYNGSYMVGVIHFPVPMKNEPSLTTSNATDSFQFYSANSSGAGTGDALDDLTISSSSSRITAGVYNNTDASTPAGNGGGLYIHTDSTMIFEAEL